jgi:hypothetical protein
MQQRVERTGQLELGQHAPRHQLVRGELGHAPDPGAREPCREVGARHTLGQRGRLEVGTRLREAEQQEVVPERVPERRLGEDRTEGAQHQRKRRVVGLVAVEPLYVDALRCQAALRCQQEFAAEQHLDAGHPGRTRHVESVA